MKKGGDYLLDSNIVIDLFRGNPDAISKIAGIKEVKIPVIVIGELYFGAYKSSQSPKRLQEIEKLEKLVTIIDVTKSTAKIYGQIKEELRIKGKPIPENDIWIAAVTKEFDLTILTKDRHFDHIDGISIEKL